LSDPTAKNPIASPVSTTVYQVRIIESSCNDTVVLATTVNILSAPIISATKSNDITCSVPEAQLNATGSLKYLWSPTEGLSNANSANPLVSISKTTQFIVKGTDGNGCEASDSVIVNVSNSGKLPFNVPTAFTPNGDGKNDCFRLRSTGYIENLQFSIFNRWGQRVFFSNDPQACWDGTFKGKMQDSGGFVYLIKGNSICGFIERKGTFMLVR
jgi:gliding motility-associated-like protein